MNKKHKHCELIKAWADGAEIEQACRNGIGSIVLADLASVAGKRYNFNLQNHPVNVFVDEAAEVINDPCIQLLNKGRGAMMRLYIATQTFADFVARTGSEANPINTSHSISLNTSSTTLTVPYL